MRRTTSTPRTLKRQALLGLAAVLVALTAVVGVSWVESPAPVSADNGTTTEQTAAVEEQIGAALAEVETQIGAALAQVEEQVGAAVAALEEALADVEEQVGAAVAAVEAALADVEEQIGAALADVQAAIEDALAGVADMLGAEDQGGQ